MMTSITQLHKLDCPANRLTGGVLSIDSSRCTCGAEPALSEVDALLKDAYRAGMDAGAEGRQLGDSPYLKGDLRSYWWRMGLIHVTKNS